MNWYLQSGNDADVVVSSRVRLSRNVQGIPFTNRAKKAELKKVYDLMKETALTIGYGLKFFDMKDVDVISKNVLVEKRMIDREFARSKNPYTAILVSDDESICIEVNGEDHIKLQAFCSGFDIVNLMNLVIELDKKLEEYVPYSYNEKYGYLNSMPTNIGTGMMASVLVHLPGLSLTNNLRKVSNVVTTVGMNILGAYGEGTKSEGDLYQISNNQTIGITEQDIITNLQVIVQKIIEQERAARKTLTKKGIYFEDKLYRALGILQNARMIDYRESLNLISGIKLGTDLGIIDGMSDLKIRKLMLYSKPANLQQRIGEKLTLEEIERERANTIREILLEDN